MEGPGASWPCLAPVPLSVRRQVHLLRRAATPPGQAAPGPGAAAPSLPRASEQQLGTGTGVLGMWLRVPRSPSTAAASPTVVSGPCAPSYRWLLKCSRGGCGVTAPREPTPGWGSCGHGAGGARAALRGAWRCRTCRCHASRSLRRRHRAQATEVRASVREKRAELKCHRLKRSRKGVFMVAVFCSGLDVLYPPEKLCSELVGGNVLFS